MSLFVILALTSNPVAAPSAQECPPFTNDYFGGELAALGDLDGDGFGDFVAGATCFGDGVIWIVSGNSGRPIRHFFGRPSRRVTGTIANAGDFDQDGVTDILLSGGYEGDEEEPFFVDVISSADGRVLFSQETSIAGHSIGYGTAVLGDLDEDGTSELSFTVYTGEPPKPSHAVVVSGERHEVLFILEGAEGPRGRCKVVAAAGDVDADGVSDIIVGGGERWRGHARLFSGANGRLLHIFEARGDEADVGKSVAAVGDLDGDGCDDIVVGFRKMLQSLSLEDQALSARAYSGRTGAALFDIHAPASVEIGDQHDHVARAGDLNGDGVCDILLATPGGNLGRWGYVTAFSGSDGVFLRRWRAERGDTRFGQSVASLGDVDGDGVADIAIGVSSPYGPGIPGEVRVFSGSSGKELYRIDQATLFEQSRKDATAVDSARKK